jgi:hypothetical protein
MSPFLKCATWQIYAIATIAVQLASKGNLSTPPLPLGNWTTAASHVTANPIVRGATLTPHTIYSLRILRLRVLQIQHQQPIDLLQDLLVAEARLGNRAQRERLPQRRTMLATTLLECITHLTLRRAA